MADFTKFRSSINGFNRSDVTDYIESISAEHQKALAEATALKQQLAEAKAQLEALQAEKDALECEHAALLYASLTGEVL